MTSQAILDIARDNRRRFLERLSIGEAALIFGSHSKSRNGDAEYSFRQASDILYLTGWPEESVALFLAPAENGPKVILFVQPKDPKREIWTGRRYGPKGAVEVFGATEAFEFAELTKKLPDLLQGIHTLHYRFAESAEHDQQVMQAVALARRALRYKKGQAPHTFVDLHHSLHQQRLYKSELELQVIRKAALITTEGHKNAIRMTKPGLFEYELEAEIAHTFRRLGGVGPGYTSIVGGGENAVILHYVENNTILNDGELVCVDAGCEYEGYTGDVTRTWPINGRFTEAQRILYSAVLKAQKEAIAVAVPGSTYHDVHKTTVRSLTKSLIELGFLDGELEELIRKKAYERWYMHGTSHWLGLDVHDVGPYSNEEGSLPLLDGMILTIEPGLYVASDDDTAPEAYRGMGIRIEDDILITASGNENLTAAAPKEIDEIEALMQGAE